MAPVSLALLVASLLSAPASATTWWLAAPEEEAPLRLALAEIWPEAPLRLRVGEPLDPRDDVWAEDGVLYVVQGEERWSRAVPPDPWLQVALARAWLRPVVEAPPPVRVEPAPTAAEVEPPPVSDVFTVVEAGAGQRLPQQNPAVRLAAATGLARGAWAVSFRTEVEAGRGERATAAYGESGQDALDATRIGMYLGLERAAEPRPDLAMGVEGRLGTRVVHTTVPLYTASSGLQAGPSLSAVATARRQGPGAVQPTCSLSLTWDPALQTLRALQTDEGAQSPDVQALAVFVDVGMRISR